MRDNPALRELPLAVGGAPERRGVVATCNYIARRYGIHSAMASSTARRLCPELVLIRPGMARYRETSQQIQAIFNEYTALIEPLSLDEAYLDLTGSTDSIGAASAVAREIRSRIADEVGITVSAGIAPNKFLAKIASDWNKPDGQFAIEPYEVEQFVSRLRVDRLHGVGKVTAAKMCHLGIADCGDLRKISAEQLHGHFGSFGNRLYELCRGIDNRPVQTSRVRKSISVENTYASDLPDLKAAEAALPALMQQLTHRMQNITGKYKISKQVVKIKFCDFAVTTVETAADGTSTVIFRQLLRQGYRRGNKPVRLLGVGARLIPVANDPAAAAKKGHAEKPQSQQQREQQLAFLLE